jgi:hypothetical protein
VTDIGHPLILGLFPSAATAAAGARGIHQLGITRDRISVVSRSHDEEGALAEQMDATPGVDLEDSRPAAVLGELSGVVLAAIALVLPGIGPIVAAGPLSAGLGETAGHVAGSVASALSASGVSEARAEALERGIKEGAVLLGVHTTADLAADVRRVLELSGAREVEVGTWTG